MATIHEINPHEGNLSAAIARALADHYERGVVAGGIVVKPHVQRFTDILEAHIGYPLSFGTYPGHSPPEGPTQALDIFNTDNESGWTQQDRICDFIRGNAERLGIRYCIRRENIWNIERDDEGWRWQGHQGNRTADHFDHTHVTFYASAPDAVDPAPEPVPAPTPTKKENDLFIYDGPKGIGGVWFTDMYSKWGVPNEDSLIVYQRGYVEHLGTVSKDFHFGLKVRNDGVADNPGVG